MDKLKTQIIEKIAELGEVDGSEVQGERPLKDLGIDSLMAIELVVFIEKLVHKPVPEDHIGKIQTCADVFREVETLLGSAAVG